MGQALRFAPLLSAYTRKTGGETNPNDLTGL
jgi:hypothetical protein